MTLRDDVVRTWKAWDAKPRHIQRTLAFCEAREAFAADAGVAHVVLSTRMFAARRAGKSYRQALTDALKETRDD